MAEGVAVDPAEARKRRKALMQRQEESSEKTAGVNNAAAEAPSPTEQSGKNEPGSDNNNINNNQESQEQQSRPAKKRQKMKEPSSSPTEKQAQQQEDTNSKNKRTTKTQIRYDPDVPMNKEQLAAWRREARRVRNRESAAASRQRIRNRITELETEVDDWKAKYNQAIQRLEDLRRVAATQNANASGGVGAAAASNEETKHA